MSFSEVHVEVIPLRFVLLWVFGLLSLFRVFSLQCQGIPCSNSFHLFFSREVGQLFLRRDRDPCRVEGPKH